MTDGNTGVEPSAQAVTPTANDGEPSGVESNEVVNDTAVNEPAEQSSEATAGENDTDAVPKYRVSELTAKNKELTSQIEELQRQIRSENAPTFTRNRDLSGLPDDIASALNEIEPPKLKDPSEYKSLQELYDDMSAQMFREWSIANKVTTEKQQERDKKSQADIESAKKVIGDDWDGFEKYAVDLINIGYSGTVTDLAERYKKLPKAEKAEAASKVSKGVSKVQGGKKLNLGELRNQDTLTMIRSS